MTIPTRMSLQGFIATAPELTFTGKGHARFFSRVGIEQHKEVDGSFTKLGRAVEHHQVAVDRVEREILLTADQIHPCGCSVGNVRSAGTAAGLRPEVPRQRWPQRPCAG
jgi:hypothetical protein